MGLPSDEFDADMPSAAAAPPDGAPVLAPVGAPAADTPVKLLRPALSACLAAPWLAIVRPGPAAVRMAGASALGALGTVLVTLVLLGIEFAMLAAWSETVTRAWKTAPDGGSTVEVHEQSIVAVWREWSWHGHGFGIAGVLLLAVTGLGMVIWFGAAWLFLPVVHGTGSAWRAYGRCLRGFAVLAGPAAALMAVIGCIYVPVYHALLRSERDPTSWRFLTEADDLVMLFGVPAAIWALIAYARLAARGLSRLSPPPELSPRCEDCGYDLRYQPEFGRCPECGLALAESLDPQVARPGTPWEQRRSLRNWARTFVLVLWRPRRAYRGMPMRAVRRDDIAFAATTYVVLGLVTTAWIVAFGLLATLGFSSSRGLLATPIEELLLEHVLWPAGLVAMASPWFWLAYRVVALVVFTAWALFRALPDFRWAGRIIAYESAAVAFPLGLLMLETLLVLALELTGFAYVWPAPGVGPPTILGVSLETIVMGLYFGPPVVYVVAAAYRYRVARRAVRWSNV